MAAAPADLAEVLGPTAGWPTGRPDPRGCDLPRLPDRFEVSPDRWPPGLSGPNKRVTRVPAKHFGVDRAVTDPRRPGTSARFEPTGGCAGAEPSRAKRGGQVTNPGLSDSTPTVVPAPG